MNMMNTRKRTAPTIAADVADRAAKRAASSDARAKADAWTPRVAAPTLSHFAQAGIAIRVECDRCRRKHDAPAHVWMARAGDVSMAALEALLTCQSCGERELVDARPLYQGLGRVTEPRERPAE